MLAGIALHFVRVDEDELETLRRWSFLPPDCTLTRSRWARYALAAMLFVLAVFTHLIAQ